VNQTCSNNTWKNSKYGTIWGSQDFGVHFHDGGVSDLGKNVWSTHEPIVPWKTQEMTKCWCKIDTVEREGAIWMAQNLKRRLMNPREIKKFLSVGNEMYKRETYKIINKV